VTLQALGTPPKLKLIGKARNFTCTPLDLKFEPRTWAIPASKSPLVTGGPVKKKFEGGRRGDGRGVGVL